MRAEFQSVPPKIKTAATPGPVIFAGIVLGATILGAGAMVFFFDPSKHSFFPTCIFHATTRLYCPGCGATRALYALLHGKFLLALKDNALFLATLAALAVWGVRFIFRKLKNRPATFDLSPKFLWGFLAVAMVFAVLRNLPGFAFLAP
jgi:hypothetical protein